MNHMGYVYHAQGQYDPQMAAVGTTTLKFTLPDSGNVLVLAQATALCSDEDSGNHTVGVLFKLYDDTDTVRVEQNALVKGQHPAHSTVCLTYLAPPHLEPGTPAKITIELSPDGHPGGSMSPDDYFSVSVVELEQSAEGASKA